METIIYGAIGILILLAAAFFLTYYDSLDSKSRHGIAKIKRTDIVINHVSESLHGIASGIPSNNENISPKKKHTSHHRDIFALLLSRKKK